MKRRRGVYDKFKMDIVALYGCGLGMQFFNSDKPVVSPF
jgi:hypothetical protein